MERVFIVTAEVGSPDDHEVWVSGVYLTLEEAKAAIEAAVNRANAYRAWEHRRGKIGWALHDLALMSEKASNDAFKAWLAKATEESNAVIGPEPPQEMGPGDNYYVAEVPVGQWGKFVIDSEDDLA